MKRIYRLTKSPIPHPTITKMIDIMNNFICPIFYEKKIKNIYITMAPIGTNVLMMVKYNVYAD